MHKNKWSNLLKFYIALAIIGMVIIVLSGHMSNYRFYGETGIYHYLIAAMIGVLLILTLVIYLIKLK